MNNYFDKLKIAKITAAISLMSVGQSIMGFLINILIASIFGVSGNLESFIVASSIPALLGNLFFLGGLPVVLISVFAEHVAKYGEKAAWEFASSLLNILLILAGFAVAVGVFISPSLVSAFAPGMSADYHILCVKITRWLFLTLFMHVLLTFTVSMLNCYKILVWPNIFQLGVSLSNLALLILIQDKIGIWILVFINFTNLFALICMVVCYRDILLKHYSPKFNLSHPGIIKSFKLMVFLSIINALNQVNLMVDRFFASLLGVGNIATYEYAIKIIPPLINIFAISVVKPIYPYLSDSMAVNNNEKMRESFVTGMRMIGLVMIPVAFFIVYFRTPFFSLLYERGKFYSQDTQNVANIFLFLSPALIFWGFAQIIVSVFYALQKNKLMMYLTFGGLLINVVGDWMLIKLMKLEGLALASSISAVYGVTITLYLLRKYFGSFNDGHFFAFFGKVAISAFAGVLFSGWIIDLLIAGNGTNMVADIYYLGMAIFTSSIIYFLLLNLLGVQEAIFLRRQLIR